MPHDSSLQLGMCNGCYWRVLEIVRTHICTVFKKFYEYMKIMVMFLPFLKYLTSELCNSSGDFAD